ncbi:MAG: T9SS type A sorting domain-containing protein [Bacteroidota bacterium]
MKYLLSLSLLYHLTCQAQIVTIPDTAEPIYAFDIIGAGPNVLDTFFIDYDSVDTFENKLWNPIFQVRYLASNNTINNSYPKLIGHQRVEGKRTFFREDNFFVQREGLMYDFDVEAGDSLWVLSPKEHPLERDSVYNVIDSINFFNCSYSDSVKVVYTTALYDYPDNTGWFSYDVWYEGAGSAFHGLFPVFCYDYFTATCEIYPRKSYARIDGEWIDVRDILCEEIPTSLTNINRKQLQTLISPNPVHKNGLLTIEAIDYRLDRVAVFDISGRQLMDVLPESQQSLQLDLAGLGSGIYVVKAYSKDGAVDVRKVVVR